MSYQDCCDYFIGKFRQWDPNGIIEPYVRDRGADALSEEFQGDSSFRISVCNYFSQFAEHRKSTLVAKIIQRVIAPFPLNISSALMDILVAAILKACRRDNQSEQLLRAVLLTSLFALVGFAVNDLIGEKPKKRRKLRK